MVQPADRYQVLPGAGVDEGFGIEAGAHVEPRADGDDSAAIVGDGSNGIVAGTNDGLGSGINGAVCAADEIEAIRESEEIPAPRQSLPTQSYRRGRGGVDSLYSIGGVHRVMLNSSDEALSRAEIRKQLELKSAWHDKDFAFTMSVRAALRERGEEARPVIMAELQQMVDKNVWHGVTVAGLSQSQRRAIIRSSMFLKDKYLASGAFDRFKARLVAGGNQQDKQLYDNLSSPTAATTSVLTIAAIAAAEGREVVVIDIGGAFLNADMEPTGVVVHMRLDRVMTAMLVQIDPSYMEFVEKDGTMVMALDKALYGCVEASALWYHDLRSRLISNGFEENPYDVCVFNKYGGDGEQITVLIHVDDLMVTSISTASIADFGVYLQSVYPEIKTMSGLVIDYIGMSFDFTIAGQVVSQWMDVLPTY